MVWFTALAMEGQERGYPINSEDTESYRSYFDGGYTVEETIDEDSSHLD